MNNECKCQNYNERICSNAKNYGRVFRSCDACEFFCFLPDTSNPACLCGVAASQHTVKKQGPNQGRAFITCGQSMKARRRCNYFEWVENKENIPPPPTPVSQILNKFSM